MPNRILRESICSSESLAKISRGAECLFYRLLTRADDFGVFKATPMVVRGECMPLLQTTDTEISAYLTELENSGIIAKFECAERQFGVFLKWDVHNKKRTIHRKYPKPPASICEQMQTYADMCKHMRADASRCLSIRDVNRDVIRDVIRDNNNNEKSAGALSDVDSIAPGIKPKTKPRVYGDCDIWGAVNKFKDALIAHNPTHTCANGEVWKKNCYRWYRQVEKCKDVLPRAFELLEWALLNGYAIGEPRDLLMRLDRIDLDRKNRTTLKKTDRDLPQNDPDAVARNIAHMRANTIRLSEYE